MNSIKAINDLKRLDPAILTRIKEKVGTVIESGWYVLGVEVRTFEEKFAKYCGSSHCVSVANGTEALELGLKALKLTHGKRVATVGNAGMYSTLAILSVGAVPVYVDVDENTLTMSVNSLEAVLAKEKVDGIIVTHLYGQLAEIKKVCELARAKNIPVIEDCAQSHGASLDGKKAGSFGDLGCFSFYPTKNLGALGDGGALVTNSSAIFEDLKKLRMYGWEKKYHVVKPDCRNSRLDEMQAGILSIKLDYLDEWNQRRRQIAQRVAELCRGVSTVRFPQVFDPTYVGHLLIVRTPKRDQLKSFLETRHIPTDIHYPLPDYHQQILRAQYQGLCLPVTEKACEEILTLPCFPELTDAEVSYIAQSLIEFDKCSL